MANEERASSQTPPCQNEEVEDGRHNRKQGEVHSDDDDDDDGSRRRPPSAPSLLKPAPCVSSLRWQHCAARMIITHRAAMHARPGLLRLLARDWLTQVGDVAKWSRRRWLPSWPWKSQRTTSAEAERCPTPKAVARTILIPMVLNDSATQLPIYILKSSSSSMHIRTETLETATLVQAKCPPSPSRLSSKHISYLSFRSSILP